MKPEYNFLNALGIKDDLQELFRNSGGDYTQIAIKILEGVGLSAEDVKKRFSPNFLYELGLAMHNCRYNPDYLPNNQQPLSPAQATFYLIGVVAMQDLFESHEKAQLLDDNKELQLRNAELEARVAELESQNQS